MAPPEAGCLRVPEAGGQAREAVGRVPEAVGRATEEAGRAMEAVGRAMEQAVALVATVRAMALSAQAEVKVGAPVYKPVVRQRLGLALPGAEQECCCRPAAAQSPVSPGLGRVSPQAETNCPEKTKRLPVVLRIQDQPGPRRVRNRRRRQKELDRNLRKLDPAQSDLVNQHCRRELSERTPQLQGLLPRRPGLRLQFAGRRCWLVLPRGPNRQRPNRARVVLAAGITAPTWLTTPKPPPR